MVKVAGGWWTAVSLMGFVAVWHVAAAILDSRVLPAPLQVLVVLEAAALRGDLLYQVGATLGRVAAAFTLAMAIGLAIGIVMGRRPLVNRLFDGWLILFLNLPALVIIILCYVWFGLTEAAAVTAVAINKIPTVVVTVRDPKRRGSLALGRQIVVAGALPSWWASMAISRAVYRFMWEMTPDDRKRGYAVAANASSPPWPS